MPDSKRPITVLARLRASLAAGRGATAAEYIVLLVLTALVVLILIRVFGDTLRGKVTSAQQEIALVDSPNTSGGKGGARGDYKSSESGSTASAATRGGAQSGGSALVSRPAQNVAYEPSERRAAATGSVGGINPLILLVVLGLVGLLIYVFFAKKSD